METGQAYIGSSRSVELRRLTHIEGLEGGVHHCKQLQKVHNDHGMSSLRFEILETGIDLNFQYAREQFWFWRHEGVLLNTKQCAHPQLSDQEFSRLPAWRQLKLERTKAPKKPEPKKQPKVAPMAQPESDLVIRARNNACLSQDQAAGLVGVTKRQWQKYESGQAGMQPVVWLHFCYLTRQVVPLIAE